MLIVTAALNAFKLLARGLLHRRHCADLVVGQAYNVSHIFLHQVEGVIQVLVLTDAGRLQHVRLLHNVDVPHCVDCLYEFFLGCRLFLILLLDR